MGRPHSVEPKHNWTVIKDDYVTGPPALTLAKVAEKHGVPPRTLYVKSAEEGWQELRESYRKRVSQETQNALATHEVEARKRHSTIAQALLGYATTEFQKHVAMQDEMRQAGETMPLMDMREVRQTIECATQLERQALGLGSDGAVRIPQARS
jgi:transposase-like protein